MDTKNQVQVLEGDAALEAFFNDEPITKEIQEETPTLDKFFEEPEEEIAQKVEKPTTAEPTPQPQPQKSDFYTNLLKEFIADGDFEDAEIEIDGQAVILSELDNVTPELFKQIKEAQKELKKQELDLKYVSVEGLDETTKKLIELKKKGGDITPLIQMDAEFRHPLQGIDLDNERVQEDLVRQKYRHAQIDEDIIEMKIAKLKKELILDKEANKVVEEINQNFDRVVEAKKQEYEAALNQRKEEEKTFRKIMTEEFRKISTKDNVVKQLVEATSKFDENGIAEIDDLFFEVKQSNPNLFAKVALLLKDEKLFNEFLGVKVKNEEAKQLLKKIQLSPTKNQQANATSSAKSKDVIDEFFNT